MFQLIKYLFNFQLISPSPLFNPQMPEANPNPNPQTPLENPNAFWSNYRCPGMQLELLRNVMEGNALEANQNANSLQLPMQEMPTGAKPKILRNKGNKKNWRKVKNFDESNEIANTTPNSITTEQQDVMNNYLGIPQSPIGNVIARSRFHPYQRPKPQDQTPNWHLLPQKLLNAVHKSHISMDDLPGEAFPHIMTLAENENVDGMKKQKMFLFPFILKTLMQAEHEDKIVFIGHKMQFVFKDPEGVI